MSDESTRREYLLTATLAGAVGLAGCSDGGSDTEARDDDDESGEGTPAVSPNLTLTPAGVTDEPDDTRVNDPQADLSTRTDASQFAATEVESSDRFGASIAVSGDGSTVAVGAPGDDTRDGSVYVFTRDGGDWTQVTKLEPEYAISELGTALSLSRDGTTALVGVGAHSSESASVFTRTDGTWQGPTSLSSTNYSDEFVSAVALSSDGTTALVGCPQPRAGSSTSGHVNEFTLTDGEWTRRSQFSPAESESGDQFGAAVALADGGETALVGAPHTTAHGDEEAGSAYLFSRDGDGWSAVSTLTANGTGTDAYDEFGAAVALADDGGTALVSSPGASATPSSRGSAYVFTPRGGDWVEQAEIISPETSILENFGGAVALAGDGETALVGAVDHDSQGTEEAGATYLLGHGSDGWSIDAKLAAEEATADTGFGDAVALTDDGATAFVGDTGRDRTEGAEGRGSTYVFDV